MNIVFIGQFVSEEEAIADLRISQAGNNYQLKFIEALSPALTISLLPIFLRRKKYEQQFPIGTYGINNQSPFRTKIINYLYRFIVDSYHAIKIIKKSNIEDVFFYNVDKQNFVVILAAKYILKRRVFILLADYLAYQSSTWFDRLSNFIFKKIEGAIVFNSNISVNTNQQVLPGFLQADQIVCRDSVSINKKVLLSGSLGPTTGLDVALETFARRPDYTLYITGRPYQYSIGEFEELITKYTSRYQNIIYLGLLEYDKYFEVLRGCDVALSLRNPHDLEHQYNFPSKILEYLSKSMMVVSTLKYPEIPSHFLFYSEFNPVSLSETLDSLFLLESKAIMDWRCEMYEYLTLNFSQDAILSACQQLVLK